MLTVQYRMNRAIMQWPSHELYQDLLTAHHSVASHTLQDLTVSACSHGLATGQPCLILLNMGEGLGSRTCL